MEDITRWSALPTIDAGRIRLRWLAENDVPRLYQIFSDPAVARYWSCPAFDDVEQARKLLADIHRLFAMRSLFQWGVVRQDLDLLIGTCTLAHVDLSNGRAEIGFAQAREHWGHGFMREAVTALIGFSFDSMGLRRLEADVDPRNDRSIALLEKLGFVREGYLRERWLVAGEIQDAAFYGLLAREWTAND